MGMVDYLSYVWVFISLFPDGNYPYHSKMIKIAKRLLFSQHRLPLFLNFYCLFPFIIIVAVVVVAVVVVGQQFPVSSSSLLSSQLVLPFPFPVVVAAAAVPKFCSESIQLILVLAPSAAAVVVVDFYAASGQQ
jgi:hypothetical protein